MTSWRDVPLEFAAAPLAFESRPIGPRLFAITPGMLGELLIADELDEGGDRQSIDQKRRCLGMVCTLDWALLQWAGESPIGSNAWTSPGEPRYYFPKGIADDPLNLKEPARLKQRMLEVLAGRTDEIVALVPSQFQTGDLAEGIRARALSILAGLGGDGELNPTFRSILASDAPAAQQAAAALGLARAGAAGELLDWARKQQETPEGRRALMTVLSPSESQTDMAGPNAPSTQSPHSSFPASFDQTALELFDVAATPQERVLAMRALVCRAAHSGVRARILEVLETSGDAEVLKEALAWPIPGLAGEERYVAAMARHLSSSSLMVKLNALAGCARSARPEFIGIAVDWARSDDERIARAAISALATLSAQDPARGLAAIDDVERRFGRGWRTAIAVAWSRKELQALQDSPEAVLEQRRRRFAQLYEK